jgi:hypothetical protein
MELTDCEYGSNCNLKASEYHSTFKLKSFFYPFLSTSVSVFLIFPSLLQIPMLSVSSTCQWCSTLSDILVGYQAETLEAINSIKMKKSESAFVSNAPRFPKEHFFFGRFPRFVICPSGKSIMQVKTNSDINIFAHPLCKM